MNERLKNHIEMLFENAPKTRKAFELKEELLTNTEERYQDLICNGVTSEDAIKNVINSIGDVSELFEGLEDTSMDDKQEFDFRFKKAVLMKTIAVGLYIFSIVVFITFASLDSMIYSNISFSNIGLILMLLIAIVPTCMLVYVSSMYPKYKKREDTLVEDFKEWNRDTYKTKSIKGSVLLVLWATTILVYFFVSYITFAWYATWIIFLAALCIHTIIELLFHLKEFKSVKGV